MTDTDILVVCEDYKELQFEWTKFRRAFFDEHFVKRLTKHPDYSFTLYDGTRIIFIARSQLKHKQTGFRGVITHPSKLHEAIRQRYLYEQPYSGDQKC